MLITVWGTISAMDYAVRDQFTEVAEETQIAQRSSDGALSQLARMLADDTGRLREVVQTYAASRPSGFEFLLLGENLTPIFTSNELFQNATASFDSDDHILIETFGGENGNAALRLATNNFEEIISADDEVRAYLVEIPPPPSDVDGRAFATRAWTEIAVWLGLILFLGMILSALVIRWTIRPIDRLTDAALQLNDGRIPEKLHPPRVRELEALFNAFNSATATIGRTADLRKQMIADLAHELRTPVTNLRSQIEAFDAGLLKDKEALGATLKGEISLLERLISDFQQLALSDSGQLPVRMMDIDLADLAAATVSSSSEDAHFVLRDELDEPIPVKADPDRVQQVLLNLVENAIRHRQEGLVIAMEPVKVAGKVGIRFSDNGPGIAASAGDKIFERFYRGEISRQQDAAGAGLGLTIARSLMAAMGGNISVSSPDETGREGASFDLVFERGSLPD